MAGAAPVHVLVVDDEAEVRTLLRSGLEPEGFEVSEAKDGAGLMALLDARPFDLITLDVRLSGEDGFALAREVRARHNVPIVMISGKGDMIDRVVGLELGADDYIAKPFHMREVLARIRAVLRRYAPVPAEALRAARSSPNTPLSYAFEGWTLDMGRRELKAPEGAPCELTTAEFNLLAVLIERPGRVLSRDELMDLLKGHDWTPLDRSIDGLVARLRKKIERGECPQLVKTVRGVGYVFAGEVRRL
jgi:DNA-binding response OmpR family regulator